MTGVDFMHRPRKASELVLLVHTGTDKRITPWQNATTQLQLTRNGLSKDI